jgi:hypothetical protein
VLHERVSPQTLGAARILVFSSWIVNVSSIQLVDYASLPGELLNQYGVLQLIPPALWDAMWSPTFLVGFQALLIGGLIWLVLGLGAYRSVAIATCIALTLFDGMAKSLGHINHAKFGILFASYILAAFPASDGLALRPRRGPAMAPVYYTAPMLAIATLIFVTYSLVGTYRVGKVGFAPFYTDALAGWYLLRSLDANPTGFEGGRWIVEHPPVYLVSKLGFAVVGTLEFLAPVCLVSKYFRWARIAVMMPVHVISLFAMNIFFWENMCLILMFATNSDRVFAPRAKPASAGAVPDPRPGAPGPRGRRGEPV